jgi:hypothetical protein
LPRSKSLYVFRAEPTHGFRNEVLALERRLFREQSRLIDRVAAADSPAFRAYERSYRRHVRHFRDISSTRQVMRDVGRADVVLVGDYRTLTTSQRTFAELVTRAAARGRPLAVALEFIEGRFQWALDEYMRGRISEAKFLERIEYTRRYTFRLWPSYRPILELARRLQLPVIGIDRRFASTESPGLLDEYAAGRIVRLAEAPEHPRIMVLVGQLHVAPRHLPAAVHRSADAMNVRPLRTVVVYQNCEDIYWQLARSGLAEQVEAVTIANGEHCLLNASPVVCQQSFVDRVDDDGEGDLIDTDAEGQFKAMARMVGAFLRIDVDDALDEVEVFTPGDLSFVASMRLRRQFSAPEIQALRRQVLARESYYVPRARAVYLATLSVNHAAEEAAHFVRHVCAGDAMGTHRGLIDSFYARALEEAMGFFGSAIVNPRRACPREDDFRRMLREEDPAMRLLAIMVLAHKRLERGRRSSAVRRLYARTDPHLFDAVTHSLGYMLGDDLHRAMVRGRLPKREIRELFRDPLQDDGSAFHTYFYLARRYGRR